MRIIVDGDAQPYKKEIINLAEKYKIKVLIITNFSHYSEKYKFDYAENIIVDNIKQAVDIKILNLVKDDDIVITSDRKLAYVLIGKKITVISERGYIFNDKFLANKLLIIYAKKRFLKNKIKGNKKIKQEDKERLLKNLEKIILLKIKGENDRQQ